MHFEPGLSEKQQVPAGPTECHIRFQRQPCGDDEATRYPGHG